MATLAELAVEGGPLTKLDPALDPDDPDAQEERLIYVSQGLKKWLQDVLPTLGSTWNIEVDPAQQVDALLEVYASGDELTYSWQFKPLTPIGEGVWELKTADVRIFGWFRSQNCFIGVVADTKERIKEHGLYPGYRSTVIRYRNQLQLDDPKHIKGDDPNAAVSNYTLPD
jgi:hypothetical protein